MIKSTTYVKGHEGFIHITKGNPSFSEGITFSVPEARKIVRELQVFIQANKNIEQRQMMLNFPDSTNKETH